MRLLSAITIIAYLRNDSQEKGEDNLLENIKAIAKSRGLSLRQLEEAAGIGQNTMSRWDENKPSVDKVKKVADALGVTVDELLKDNDS